MSTAVEEQLAREARRRQRAVLAEYRGSAPWEELEDIYAQSVLEILLRVRRDPTITTPTHLGAALELRVKSRVADYHRALAGRSPRAVAQHYALRLDDPNTHVADSTDIEREVIERQRLRQLLHAITNLPASKRDALLGRGAATDTRRKRAQRARATLWALEHDEPQVAETDTKPQVQLRGEGTCGVRSTPLLNALARRNGGGAQPLAVARCELQRVGAHMQRVRAQLDKLPLAELAKLDDVAARSQKLTTQRDELRAEVTRFATNASEDHPAHADAQTRQQHPRLLSVLNATEQQLQQLTGERDTITGSLGDINVLQHQRVTLTRTFETLTRYRASLAAEVADVDLIHPPHWLQSMLGERPAGESDARRWDRAAHAIASYREQYAITRPRGDLGGKPVEAHQQLAYRQARRAHQEYTRTLHRDLEHDR
jgi:hypothetical protein